MGIAQGQRRLEREREREREREQNGESAAIITWIWNASRDLRAIHLVPLYATNEPPLHDVVLNLNLIDLLQQAMWPWPVFSPSVSRMQHAVPDPPSPLAPYYQDGERSDLGFKETSPSHICFPDWNLSRIEKLMSSSFRITASSENSVKESVPESRRKSIMAIKTTSNMPNVN